MTATIIAWTITAALVGGLSWLLYHLRKTDRDNALDKASKIQADQNLAALKDATDREKAINVKPLPSDVDSVVDRLPE